MNTFNILARAFVEPLYTGDAINITVNSSLPDVAASPYYALWYNCSNYSNPFLDPFAEIIQITDNTKNNLSIVRGQLGTSASAKNIGSSYCIILLPPDVDGTTIQNIRGILSIPDESIDYTKLSPSLFGLAVYVDGHTNQLNVYVDNTTIGIVSNQLTLLPDAFSLITSDTVLNASHKNVVVKSMSPGVVVRLSLPLASSVPGKRYAIKIITDDAGIVWLIPNGIDTIEGVSGTQILTAATTAFDILSDGTTWWKI